MTNSEYTRVTIMVAEMRALELVVALRHAVSGASHWKLEAENLLTLIDSGVPPKPLQTPHQEAA